MPTTTSTRPAALLPTADGCRTQILSTRWRTLWRSAPLNYEVCVRTAAQKRLRAAAILRAHPGPTRRFSLWWQGRWSKAYSVVDDLLRQPVLDDLPVLELHYAPDDFTWSYPHNPSPPSMFRFWRTLRVLSVSCEDSRIDFSKNNACCSVDFPQLEQLTLKHVSISEKTLHAFLSRCHVLQSLILHHNIGYRRLRVTSCTLRSLGVTTDHVKDSLYCERWQETRFEEVIVEHAPLLEGLIPDDVKYDMKIRVIHAPKLRILGYLYSGDAIKVFKGVELVSPTNAIRTVKILALNTVANVDVIVEFLLCFPCVEKLNLVDTGRWTENAQRDVSLECLYAHLKNVQLTPYTGNRSQVQLIRFFLSNARLLKSMTLGVCHQPDAKSMASQRKKLMLDNRASQDVELYFKADRFWSLSHVLPTKDIHNLTLDNPFRI